ncbi:hypothetical protein AXF42_Ash015748 [Apostasia shenzhenica]|uniref:Uncharacterized protein n=1 Tax=Apostasia shenzhenica TaxID=1088818 RepID=A0A2H9ZU87_9ASPA|nr:hypothetical protein AXF42_Ash015748 [Apostasia shenzhenica]
MRMHAVLFPNGGLRAALPAAPAPAKFSIHSKQIADAVLVASGGGRTRSSNSTFIRSEGSRGRRPRRSVSSDEPREEGGDELKKKRSGSSGSDEVLALFRRIQESISKEGGAKIPRRRRGRSADPISGSLRARDEGIEPRRQGRSGSEDDSASRDSQPSRPFSKFVRRSPIPVAPRRKAMEKVSSSTEERSPGDVEKGEPERADPVAIELQKIDGMKLSELKELARAKQIRGFSKLKKGELVRLLKERLHSSP